MTTQGQPCCNCPPTTCRQCCNAAINYSTGSPDTISVDLGSGGLDGTGVPYGGSCNEITGTVVLAPVPTSTGCQWSYSFPTGYGYYGSNSVVLAWLCLDTTSGKCRWIVNVLPETVWNSGNPGTYYVSADTDLSVANCRSTGPWTLVKYPAASAPTGTSGCTNVVAENEGPCNGSLPSTITLTLN